MHTLPLQIRFNDVDAMGHINNAVILEYFDLGKASFLASHGLNAETGDFTVMVVHVDIDFTCQIQMHDDISVSTQIDHIGNKSLHLIQQVSKADGTVCATCKTVMSGYRRSTKSSAVIPDQVRAALSD